MAFTRSIIRRIREKDYVLAKSDAARKNDETTTTMKSRTLDEIYLTQSKYIRDMLQRHDMK